MATTISSGRGNSPLLTANIADHGTIYGGRGLIFDGVTDYIETSNNVSTSATSTYSFWCNLTSISGTRDFIQHANVYFRAIDNELYLYSDFSNHNRYDNIFVTGSWNHFTYVANGTTHKLYMNGVEQTPAVTTSTAIAVSTSSKLNISTGGNRFSGTMADFKYFDASLTEAQVQELYLKPEQSAPSDVQANLKQWFPMCEGNPDSPQSIVYDHSEKGLGAELLTDGDMEISGTTNWQNDTTAYKIPYSDLSKDTSIKYSGSQSLKMFNDTYPQSGVMNKITTLDTSKTYKWTGWIRGDSTTVASSGFDVAGDYDGGFAGDRDIQVATYSTTNGNITADTWVQFTHYFRPTAATVYFGIWHRVSGGSVWIDDWSVKECQTGNHATTVFLGDELHGGNWVDVDMVGFASASARGFTAVNTDGSAGDNDNAGGNQTTLTAGKTYQISYTITPNSGVALPLSNHGLGTSTTDYNTTNFDTGVDGATSARNISDTYTPTSTAGYYPIIKVRENTVYNFTITNYSIKEVGISSTGFATADSEPTIPQVPLLRYNEKMVFDGVDDKVDLGTSVPKIGTSDFTISFWVSGITSFQDKRILGSDGVGGGHWSFHSDTSDTVLRFNSSLSVISSALPNSGTLGDGTLRHIVMSADRSGNCIYYINGVSHSTHSISSDTTDLEPIRYVGTYYNASAFTQMNTFNELSQWNVALSATEVQELFADGVALDATTHSKANNLMGYWRNDGITTWADRKGWDFLNFDATGDYVDCGTGLGTSLGDNYAGSLSASLWFKADVTAGDDGIFAISDFGSSNGEFYAQMTADNIKFWVNNVWHRDYAFTDKSSWHHLVCVYTAGDKDASLIYVDGSSVGSETGTFPSASDMDLDGLKTIIGGYNSTSYLFDGQISQFAMYNKALTSAEVTAQHNLGLTGNWSSDDGLVGYWKLDTASTDANAIKDLSTNSNHGTVQGNPILNNDGTVSGTPESIIVREGLNSNRDGLGFPFKNADRDVLRFMGNSPKEYLSIADSDSFDVQGDFTVEFWMKQPDMGVGYQHIVNRDDTSNRNWTLYSTNGALTLTIYSGGSGTTVTTTATFDDDNWHHVCGIVKAGTSIQIYVDKVLEKLSTSSIPTTIDNDPTVFNVGRRVDEAQYFKGLVDEVRFYNKALTAYKANGDAPAESETATSGELVKNYKHGKGKHKN